MKDNTIERRDFLKKSMALSAGLTLAGGMLQSFNAEAAAVVDNPMAAKKGIPHGRNRPGRIITGHQPDRGG